MFDNILKLNKTNTKILSDTKPTTLIELFTIIFDYGYHQLQNILLYALTQAEKMSQNI